MAERRLGEFGLTLNPPLWTMLGLEKKKEKISVDRPSTGYQPSCSMGLTVRFSAGELTAMARHQQAREMVMARHRKAREMVMARHRQAREMVMARHRKAREGFATAKSWSP